MRGSSNGDLYTFHPMSQYQPTALASTCSASPSLWHARFGHPSFRVLAQMMSSCGNFRNLENKKFHCNSCHINKSHKLPFSVSSIKTTTPLELLFSDVWGPSPITSVNGYKYYLVFVDHFTRYSWIYPLKSKTDVVTIFPNFHSKVETMFSYKVKSLYTDGGTEYIKLSPPYTPEHIGIAEAQ